MRDNDLKHDNGDRAKLLAEMAAYGSHKKRSKRVNPTRDSRRAMQKGSRKRNRR